MKKLMTILFAVIAIVLTAQAQIVQPVKWTGVVEGDSVKLTANIEKGWHLNIIELGEGFYLDEYLGLLRSCKRAIKTSRHAELR